MLRRQFSGRDLILGAGGLFLLGKSALEIHHTLEGAAQRATARRCCIVLATVVLQIALIDIVFSLDSVFTAVGLARAGPAADHGGGDRGLDPGHDVAVRARSPSSSGATRP